MLRRNSDAQEGAELSDYHLVRAKYDACCQGLLPEEQLVWFVQRCDTGEDHWNGSVCRP